jgi:RNA polymerase sigma-70 factor (ECF subfamily)
MAPDQHQQSPGGLDSTAFGRLFDDLMPEVYAFVAARARDRAAAEEITAAAFRRMTEIAGQEPLDAASFRNFLFNVAASAVVDHARRNRRDVPLMLRAGDFDRGSDSRRSAEAMTDELAARAFTAAIDRAAVRRAVQRLPEAQRRVIVLCYLDQLDVDEQCAALGCSRESLARRLNTALRALRAALAEEAVHAA